jgi:hypothetical protein
MGTGLGISLSVARKAIKDASWDVANEVLYALCRLHPNHDDEAVNIAKVWLIGRAYAAAIERGSKSDYQGDDLYTKRVGPALKQCGMDKVLMPVRKLRRPDAKIVCKAHAAIVVRFRRISKLNHPSLASKYLHFHCPGAVYIYDSRAVRAIGHLTKSGLTRKELGKVKDGYPKFFARCEAFRKKLEAALGRRVTPRELDKVLLAADRQLSKDRT